MWVVRKMILCCLVISLPLFALSWGMLGHRIVGQIAESYLSPKARTAVKRILGDSSMAIWSNWADFVKSDHAYDSLEKWHYVDLDSGLTKTQAIAALKSDTEANLYTKMTFIIQQLKKGQTPLAQKKFYLKLLIHFVGDMHQPLHVGRKNTAGGNKIKVQWFNNQSNLHSIWDESLINHQQLTYKDYAEVINHTTAAQRQAWQKSSIAEWMAESYLLSERLLSEIKDENPKLSYAYNYNHISLVNEQLVKGGVRLAGLLNEIFK